MSARRERAHLLESGVAEPEPLELQARVWEPEAERMLDRIGLSPGARCLDAGCGPVGILAALSRRVGPKGHVLGIDTDAGALAAARESISREGLENVELLEADACGNKLPRASFDLVHARFLYSSVGRDAELARELTALARPGGVVAAQEPDSSSWCCYPEPPAFAPLRDAVLAAYRHGGGDFDAGRRIFGLLRDSGLQNVQIRPALIALQSGHPYMRLPLLLVESLRSRILQGRILSARALDQAIAGYEAFLREPGGYMVPFTVMQAWGRKAQR